MLPAAHVSNMNSAYALMLNSMLRSKEIARPGYMPMADYLIMVRLLD